MKSYTSTCILNHTHTTRFGLFHRRWWNRHQHPEVMSVRYDERGFVKQVTFR